MKIIVTGGAGFIGSALIRCLITNTEHKVLNADKLTYAASLSALQAVAGNPRYSFVQADICDAAHLAAIFAAYDPDGVIHLAAETHVDRSIDGPSAFIKTNIEGTFCLLDAALAHLNRLSAERRQRFRFVHVSTDEVFGSLGATGKFTENTPYDPRSPYSASKAASDHLARSWHHTYGLPVIITNCSNNYGPYQFPEKLIPLCISKAMNNEPIPVYGKGENVRDWLHVEDHAHALRLAFEHGAPGETYAIGGDAERRNIDVVAALCGALDEQRPKISGGSYRGLVTFVADRPGHDHRYAIDATKIKRELGWHPRHNFEAGIKSTTAWYLEHEDWWRDIKAMRYNGERIGQLVSAQA